MILRDSETYSTQIWIGIGLFGAIMILAGVLTPRLRASREPMGKDSISYNYEMPRVETEDMPFDLSDREVSRKMRELEALAKKKKEIVKAADQKKAQEAAAVAKKMADAKVAAAVAARNKAFSVNTTDASDRFNMKSGLSAETGGTSSPDYAQYGAGYANPPKPASNNTQKEAEEEADLSADQWRSLMMADPSTANITKFLKARADGKVVDATVVDVARDLLKDAADDRHKAAMILISAVPSAVMFEFLVKEKSEFAATLQSELQVYQDAYSSPAKLVYLGPLLASSSETTVLSAAMEQITVAVANYKKSQSGNISQGAGLAPSLNQLQIFIATLKNVSSSDDSTVAQLAQTLTQDIQGLQSTTNIAQASLRR